MKTIVSICVAQFFQVAPAHLPSCLLLEDHCLQKSWLCSGQRGLCWLTECCCHNLSSWLLRRISGRPQSSSPESSEPCNYPWSSQSLCGRGNKEEYFKTSVSSSMLCKVEVLGPGKAPNLLKEQICLEDGLVCQPSPTPTCSLVLKDSFYMCALLSIQTNDFTDLSENKPIYKV